MTLDGIQLRVLGSLIEKEITTPENYPLSLNALLAACNQRSSRDPVLELTEEEVRQALHGLEDLGLTAVVRDSRVPKFEHRARTVLNLRRDETALLCLLLLRGPQTPGELRSRAERLYSFDGLDSVESTLARLASEATEDGGGTRPLATILPRQPGSREARFAHLLDGGAVAAGGGAESARQSRRAAEEQNAGSAIEGELDERVGALEAEIAGLRNLCAALEARLANLEMAKLDSAGPTPV